MVHYTPAQTRWFLAAIEAGQAAGHRAQVLGARAATLPRKAFVEYLAAVSAPPAAAEQGPR